MMLHEALAGFAETRGAAPCMLGLGGSRGSWSDVWKRVDAGRRYFAAHRGRVVALALEDGPEAAEVLLSCLLSGAIAFPLPPHATAHEREQLLSGLDVAMILWPEGDIGESASRTWPIASGLTGVTRSRSGSGFDPSRS